MVTMLNSIARHSIDTSSALPSACIPSRHTAAGRRPVTGAPAVLHSFPGCAEYLFFLPQRRSLLTAGVAGSGSEVTGNTPLASEYPILLMMVPCNSSIQVFYEVNKIQGSVNHVF